MVITDRKQFPKCIRHFKEVIGISIGQCISNPPHDLTLEDGRIKHFAHAHNHDRDNDKGWICLCSSILLADRLVMLHEVAHLLMPETEEHGNKWRDTLVKIGGSLNGHGIVYKTIHNEWVYTETPSHFGGAYKRNGDIESILSMFNFTTFKHIVRTAVGSQ